MRNFEHKTLSIEDLYVNPENYRYINDASDELDAIIYMFNVNTGSPVREMINLSKDIIEDGLNPFEMPIVCYDEDLKKYVVYDGNRRITCIKLMTQYKDNNIIRESVPAVTEIYKLNCNINEIHCVNFFNPDDAKHFLYKIHQDVNEGVGRKQWDSQAKMKAQAAAGNKSKTYSIVEFVKKHPNTDKTLINDMDTNRWISKLERVVSFTRFREVYNISFDDKNGLVYKDTEEQVIVMMSKLIYDIIHNSATDNFRFKADFESYTQKLDEKFKTQVIYSSSVHIKNRTSNKPNSVTNQKNKETEKPCNSNNFEKIYKDENEAKEDKKENSEKRESSATGVPRNISKRTSLDKAALKLGKSYCDEDYLCLNEKGKQMLMELEALDIKAYPFATAALCRALLECVLKLWIDNVGHTKFDSKSLASTYNGCLNVLRSQNIIDNNENSILKAQINKEDFITLLNTWIHSDTSACVSETNLVSGWKNTRLLIEKYIDMNKKRDV